ncbi:Muc1p [Alternaria alternata]|nr:Muc1p [Alternaria alternata]
MMTGYPTNPSPSPIVLSSTMIHPTEPTVPPPEIPAISGHRYDPARLTTHRLCRLPCNFYSGGKLYSRSLCSQLASSVVCDLVAFVQNSLYANFTSGSSATPGTMITSAVALPITPDVVATPAQSTGEYGIAPNGVAYMSV